MARQIRTIGFRNALFVGQVNTEQKSNDFPDGIGLIVDDMFLTCLSTWSSQSSDSIKAVGPSVLFYPNREIFYAQQFPAGGKFFGFWCFITSQLQIYGNGDNGNLVFVQPGGNTISKAVIKQNRFEHIEDDEYSNPDEKWGKIQEILRCRVDPNCRSIDRFIQANFMIKMNREQGKYNFISAKPKKSEILYGISGNNQGIGVGLKTQVDKILVSSVGYYREFQPINQMAFGRKYTDLINSSSYRVEQGNFQTQEVFVTEFNEERPSESYKNCRKYYRQCTNFCNKFLQLADAGVAYKKLKNIQKQYVFKIDSKYGQRIIEGQIENKPGREQKLQPEKYESEKYKQAAFTNREYNLSEAKAKIEQEISKRKATGSVNYTGTFNMYKNANTANTISNTNTKKDVQLNNSNRKSIESSPIQHYKVSYSEEMTNRNQRSPRANTQRYQYTDTEEAQPAVAGDWKKQSKTYYDQQKHHGASPTRFISRQPRIPTKRVNQFTLHPVEMEKEEIEYAYYQRQRETQRQKQRQRQRQRQRERQRQRLARLRNIQKERILREIEYQVEKQKEQKMMLLKKQEKQNQRIMLENNYGAFTKRTHNLSNASINPYIPVLHEANIQSIPVPQTISHIYPPLSHNQSLYPIEQASKRRYFHAYNYTQQTANLKQKTPAKPARIETKPSYSPSPINRLKTNTSPELAQNFQATEKRQISKSPIGRGTGRKVYTYVD